MPVMLPRDLYEKTIDCLKPGESGFTDPKAMSVDYGGECYLDTTFSIDHPRRDTHQIKITRCRTKPGFTVDISSCPDYRWKEQTIAFPASPVLVLIRGPYSTGPVE